MLAQTLYPQTFGRSISKSRNTENLALAESVHDIPPAVAMGDEININKFVGHAARLMDLSAGRIVFRLASGPWKKAQASVPDAISIAEQEFIAYAQNSVATILVGDLTLHPSFSRNPLVINSPHIRSLAAIRINENTHVSSGVLLLFGQRTRKFDKRDEVILQELASLASHEIELLQSTNTANSNRQSMDDNDSRYRTAFENAPVGIAHIGFTGSWLRVNKSLCDTFGYTREELLEGRITDIIHPDDAENSTSLFASLMSGEIDNATFEGRYLRKNGENVWVRATRSLHRDATGEPLHCISIIEDITERKRAEEQQTLMMRELSHRVKNTLATVSAIAQQSSRTASDTASFLDSFEARLQSLASSHNLLSQSNWAKVPLAELIRQQVVLSAGGGQSRVSIDGEAVALDPELSLNVGLILHELATNAMKYGALSRSGGHLDVSWTTFDKAGEKWLKLVWNETCPGFVKPPPQTGFGSFLIDNGLTIGLGGVSERRFEKDGLKCRLEMPVY